MEEIDQPFRPKMDFFIAWGILTIPFVLLTRQWVADSPWYSRVASFIIFPFFATFVVYGPVLFVQQVLRSGLRGRRVFREFLLFVVVASIAGGTLLAVGEHRAARVAILLILVAAKLLLDWSFYRRRHT